MDNKFGKFIESKISKNAPLLFLIGGMDINNVKPGDYMMSKGFKNLTDFNIYNINRTQGGGFTNVLNAWKECKDNLKELGINPSKKILIGYSLGAEYSPRIYGEDKWDLFFSAGAAIPGYGGNYTTNKKMITILTENDANGTPIASSFVYVHSNKSAKGKNGDGQILPAQKEFERLLPKNNVVSHNGNHGETVTATANWIKSNVIVNKDGTAQINIKTKSTDNVFQDLLKKKGKDPIQPKISKKDELPPKNPTIQTDTNTDQLKPYKITYRAGVSSMVGTDRSKARHVVEDKYIVFKATESEWEKIKKEKAFRIIDQFGTIDEFNNIVGDVKYPASPANPPKDIFEKFEKIDESSRFWTDTYFEPEDDFSGYKNNRVGYALSTPKESLKVPDANSNNNPEKTENGETKGPITSQSDACETDEPRDAVRKSQNAAETSGDIKKDAPPPSKNEIPQISDNKYNHRYYILPISATKNAEGSVVGQQLSPFSDGGGTEENNKDKNNILNTYKVKIITGEILYVKLDEEAAKNIEKEKKITYKKYTTEGNKFEMQYVDRAVYSITKVEDNKIPQEYEQTLLKNQKNSYFSKLNKTKELKPENNSEKNIVSYPAPLKDMVNSSGPWYNRYWAYRLNSGPNYGFEKYETTISENGIDLISAVIPYWHPPKDPANPNSSEKQRGDWQVRGNWKKLIDTDGGKFPTITSPIDIPIVLNSYQSGVMNNRIKYIYESENELHMTILENEIINKGKIAIGQGLNDSDALNKVPDSSWPNYPRWSGIFTEHCLKNTGFNLQEKIGTNIDFYHRSILSRNRLVNHPGDEVIKWKKLKPLGIKHRMFKPSKIWLDPKYFNGEEHFETDDNSVAAIFVVGFHFDTSGKLTKKGERLVNYINNELKWPMATISAIPHHTSNSTLCYIDVLLYMDNKGTLVTIGGNTNVPGGNSSLKSGNHIALKVTNFAKFANISSTQDGNASVFIAKVKGGPEPTNYRVKSNLSSKLYTTEIFSYYERAVTAPPELLTETTYKDRLEGKYNYDYYDKLSPYISKNRSCYAISKIKDDESLFSPTKEPEYITDNEVQPPNMEEISKEKCSDLKQKYNLSSNTCIPGISAQAYDFLVTDDAAKNCKGNLNGQQIANVMAAIAASETDNRYYNRGGGGNRYSGRYQFGPEVLQDLGYLKSGNVDNNKAWTGKNGIKSREDFLNCPIVQEQAMQELIQLNLNRIKKVIPSDKFQDLRCDYIAGLLTIAHLVGAGAAQEYHKSNGSKIRYDGNNMSSKDYFLLGLNACNGKFFIPDTKSDGTVIKIRKNVNRRLQGICKGSKYFLYPGVLSNGLNPLPNEPRKTSSDDNTLLKMRKGRDFIINNNPNTAPQPANDTVEISPGEFFVKFSPSTVKILTLPKDADQSEIGKSRYLPEKFINEYGIKNGMNCSWFELTADNNKFGRTFIPPLITDSISFTEFGGKPAYKSSPSKYSVPYLCYIDNNNNFNISTVPFATGDWSQIKYAFSTKWLGFTTSQATGKKRYLENAGGSSDTRAMIGVMDDGNMFVWSSTKNRYTVRGAAERVAKIPGTKTAVHMDGGGSVQLYYNGKFLTRASKTREFPNYLTWD